MWRSRYYVSIKVDFFLFFPILTDFKIYHRLFFTVKKVFDASGFPVITSSLRFLSLKFLILNRGQMLCTSRAAIPGFEACTNLTATKTPRH